MTTITRLTFFFFNDTATTEIYTLPLHDALPISTVGVATGSLGAVDAGQDPVRACPVCARRSWNGARRCSEIRFKEIQSRLFRSPARTRDRVQRPRDLLRDSAVSGLQLEQRSSLRYPNLVRASLQRPKQCQQHQC